MLIGGVGVGTLLTLLAHCASGSGCSPVRARFTKGVVGVATLLAGLTPRLSKERRRKQSLAALSTLVGAVALARAVDDETLVKELLEAATASATR